MDFFERWVSDALRRYKRTSDNRRALIRKYYTIKTFLEVENDRYMPEGQNLYKDIKEEDIGEYFKEVIKYEKQFPFLIKRVFSDIEDIINQADPENELYSLYQGWLEDEEKSEKELREKYNIHGELDYIMHNLDDRRAVIIIYWSEQLRKIHLTIKRSLGYELADAEKDYFFRFMID